MPRLRTRAEPVNPRPLATELPHDKDLPSLEVAAEAGAILVTGNPRHFPARARGGVTVVAPAELLDLLRHRRA